MKQKKNEVKTKGRQLTQAVACPDPRLSSTVPWRSGDGPRARGRSHHARTSNACTPAAPRGRWGWSGRPEVVVPATRHPGKEEENKMQ